MLRLKADKIFKRLLAFATVFIALLYFLRPIYDTDFFGHLATGKWIIENLSLPYYEPFAFTSPSEVGSWTRFSLTSYWLSQTLYYAAYSLIGYSGIILVRDIAGAAIFYFMYRRGASSNRTILYCLLLISMVIVLRTYPLERPQIFSFMFFSVMLFLLSAPERKYFLLLPPVMIVWANMHGGHILGQVLIFLCIATEGLKFLNQGLGPMKAGNYRRFVIVGAVGILAAFVNPNTYRTLIELMFMTQKLGSDIVELKSTVFVFRRSMEFQIVLYWLMIVCVFLISLHKSLNRRPDITEIGMFAGLGFFSFTQLRYMGLFVIWCVPVISQYLDRKFRSALPRAALTAVTLSICAYAVFFRAEIRSLNNISNLRTQQWVSNYFPESAVGFIRSVRPEGNMFNHFDWGGYLIWRLYPEKQVFIEGRAFYEHVLSQSSLIAAARPDHEAMSRPLFKKLIDDYGITFVLLPPFNLMGEMIPLTLRLLEDPAWAPVFLDRNAFIMMKDSPENSAIISRYGIPKNMFVTGMAAIADSLIKRRAYNLFTIIGKGDLFMSSGRFSEAKETYETALRLFPGNEKAKSRLKELNNRTGMH